MDQKLSKNSLAETIGYFNQEKVSQETEFVGIQVDDFIDSANDGFGLKTDDRVVGAEIVHPGNTLLTVTSNGYGKRTQLEEYPVQGRGGLGVMTIRCNEKIGAVVGVQQVTENDQLLVITSDGNIVRMKVNEISVIGRNTQGVRLVGTGESNQVVSVEKLVE